MAVNYSEKEATSNCLDFQQIPIFYFALFAQRRYIYSVTVTKLGVALNIAYMCCLCCDWDRRMRKAVQLVAVAMVVVALVVSSTLAEAADSEDYLLTKRASWADMKRASWADMKRASWADMKRASWADMKRASWADMKRSGVQELRRALHSLNSKQLARLASDSV